MTTTKKRINITVPKALEDALGRLSKRDDMPVASKAVELLRIAIEAEEDEVLGNLAEERDTKGAKFIPHHKAWL